MTTNNNTEARELSMFGCTSRYLKEIVENNTTHELVNISMSMLSDAQHETELGRTEDSRKTINRAKYLLDEIKRRLNVFDAYFGRRPLHVQNPDMFIR